MENNYEIKNLSIWKAFKKIYLEKGIPGLYAGWRMKFL